MEMTRGLFCCVHALLLLVACARRAPVRFVESAPVVGRHVDPSPFRRVFILPNGELYLERPLNEQTAASIADEEIKSALWSLIAVRDDGTATPLGASKQLDGLYDQQYPSVELLQKNQAALALHDWQRLVGKEVRLSGRGYNEPPAKYHTRQAGLRRILAVRLHAPHGGDTRARCDVCGFPKTPIASVEFRVREDELQFETSSEDATPPLDMHERWAGAVELSALAEQSPEVRIVLDELIQKANPVQYKSFAESLKRAPRERLQELLKHAPRDAVAIGYTHNNSRSPELRAEGTYSSLQAKYSLSVDVQNTLSSAMPPDGRTQLVRLMNEDAAPSAPVNPLCMLTSGDASSSLAMRELAKCYASRRYPLDAGIAPGEKKSFVLERDQTATIFQAPIANSDSSRLLLCNEDKGRQQVYVRWQSAAAQESKPQFACQTPPPSMNNCQLVDGLLYGVQNAIVSKRLQRTTGRAWNVPVLPLADPPRAREGHIPERYLMGSYSGMRAGCAFFETDLPRALGRNANVEITPGLALQSDGRNMKYVRGSFVTPRTSAMSFEQAIPRFGCGWAESEHLRRLEENRHCDGSIFRF